MEFPLRVRVSGYFDRCGGHESPIYIIRYINYIILGIIHYNK